MSMSGFEPQSLQTSTTPSSSWQQGSTSNPSTALPGPLTIPHLSPDTPSGDSPQFNPYHTTLKTPTPTPNNPDAELKPIWQSDIARPFSGRISKRILKSI